MQSFVRKVDNSEPISGSSGLEDINYHDLELDRKDRQAGMRKFENEQIFVLSQLQRYCSVTSESYSRYKPYIEGDIAESERYIRNFKAIAWESFIELVKFQFSNHVESPGIHDRITFLFFWGTKVQ